jgi:hypothetical protein
LERSAVLESPAQRGLRAARLPFLGLLGRQDVIWKRANLLEEPELIKLQPANSIEPAPAKCGPKLVVRYRGWVWLLDREHQQETLLPADGVIGCSTDGLISTYRARRVDIFNPQYQPSQSEDIKLSSLPSKGRK